MKFRVFGHDFTENFYRNTFIERFEIRLCQPKGRDLVLDMFPTSSLAHISPDCNSLNRKSRHFFALSPSFKAIWCYQSMPERRKPSISYGKQDFLRPKTSASKLESQFFLSLVSGLMFDWFPIYFYSLNPPIRIGVVILIAKLSHFNDSGSNWLLAETPFFYTGVNGFSLKQTTSKVLGK